jgi:hypothetical protein
MFQNNRYTSIYLAIVLNAQVRGLDKRVLEGYFEEHHIIPTALDGPDTDENKVLLTAREHFLCHLLLTRMTTGTALIRMRHAFSYMALCHSSSHARHKTNSHWYHAARKMAMQERDQQWRDNISKALKGRPQPKEAVEKMRAALTGRPLTKEHAAKISANHARSKAKPFDVLHPSGKTERINNLREFCRDHDLDYQLSWLSSKKDRIIKKGPMKGWCFTSA